jgi:hypothetical protein
MSEQLQLRRGTSSQVASFTGAQGEVVIDTTNNRLVLQDGSTVGGWPAAKLAEVVGRVAVAGTSYACAGSELQIAYTSLATAVAVTLPAAASFQSGKRLLIIDETGVCSTTNTITVQRSGSDTINGQASFAINCAYGFLGLESNGSNAWTVTDSFNTVAQGPNGASMQFAVIETLVSGLSGGTVTAPVQIPANCIVFSVGARVVAAISGATSYSVGDSGSGDSGASASRFGSSLNVAAGSTNYGLIGPTAIYAPTSLTLTSAGGAFTGGAVRLSIHLAFCAPSAS